MKIAHDILSSHKFLIYMSTSWNSQNSFQWQTQEKEDVAVLEDKAHNLIVWNDDVNTFDWVIESLMAICEHSPEQAEQCSLIIHHKGKCGVKKGSFEILRPQCEALIERGINATIDY
jgi:ATP-dependent Clp protease adaptor protein ClpS